MAQLCCPFFFSLNLLLLTDATTAMKSFSPTGCCWVPPHMLHWTVKGVQPLMAGPGPVAPHCPHIWQSHLRAAAVRQRALLQHREGGKKWGCPLSTCLCVCEALMLLCPATRIYTCFKNSGVSGRRKRRGTNLFAS